MQSEGAIKGANQYTSLDGCVETMPRANEIVIKFPRVVTKQSAH